MEFLMPVLRAMTAPILENGLRLVGLALSVCCLTVNAAEYDLCVRGTTLEETRTLHLKLKVEGADVSAFAPRLGAALANRRFWDHSAQKVYGAPFDADLCGAAVAEEQSLSVTLTDEQAHALEAESTRGMDDGLLAAVDRILGRDSSAPAAPAGEAAGPGQGDQIRDDQGNLLYNLMRVYYATDRKDTASAAPEERFSGDRGVLTLGVAQVTIPKTHRRGGLEAPSILRLEFHADPQKHVLVQSLRVLDVDAWRAEIGKQAVGLNNAGILVFVHGYNTSFADAARRAGQLAYDLNFAGATVLFSWPSRAQVVEYTADEQNAEWSISDMKSVLDSLATVAPGTPIYIIAHSMGNRVLTRGYKALLDEDGTKRRAFNEIVLAAPDLDADVFKREIAPAILGRSGGPRVTLYASSNDKALMASRDLHGGYRRLGESGKDLVVMRNLDTVDASNVRTEFLGHGYFADSVSVVSDIKYVVHERLKPQERERYSLDPVTDLALGLYWRFKGHPTNAATGQ
jgi:esterase/lipase superfamily enzyme